MSEINYQEAYEREHEKCADLADKIVVLESEKEDLQFKLDRIKKNKFWKATGPARSLIHFAQRQRDRLSHCGGPKDILRKIRNKSRQKSLMESYGTGSFPDAEQRKKEEETIFPYMPKISILVPLWNNKREFQIQMLDCVMNQTYPNWELCLADGSDAEHSYIEELCREYAAKANGRIVYKHLDHNGGISYNTNECYKLATGDYIGLFDQDDILHPSVLYAYVKEINEQGADYLYCDETTFKENDINKMLTMHFKPDYAPDNLRANNYICHFCVIKKSLIEEMGGLRSEFDGAQDYDLVFRCVEKTITAHVPRILYHWRVHQVSTADNPISKTYAFEAGQRAIEAHLLRCGEHAEVLPELDRGFYRVRYKVQGNPKISILIPNKDHVKDLEKCLQSISKSIYKNYEITIIENNSKKAETFAYYDKIESDHIRILRWDGPFNYSAINNYAVSETDGEYLVLLNNDTEVIGKDWLGEMLANCQRKEVGIVGAKLYYPNGQVQHAGVIVGIRGIAGNMFRGLPKGYSGYLHKASTQQDLSAVTAACMMVKRSVYEEVGGFEEQLAVAFNDIDFCLKVRRCGYLVVYDPYVKLYHYESRSRGAEDNEEKIRRYQCEIDYVRRNWSEIMEKGDPMYNPNLTLVKCDYSLREKEDG